MEIKPIKGKDEIVKIIKSLAKDLDARAEDIANDWNKRLRSIEIHSSIEIGYISEWDITKHYGLLTDEMIKEMENIINNPNDTPKSKKAQASISMPLKKEKSITDEIGEAVKDSINITLSNMKIGIDYGDGLSKSSMFRNGGDG